MNILSDSLYTFVSNSFKTVYSSITQLTRSISSIFHKIFPQAQKAPQAPETKEQPILLNSTITCPKGKTVVIFDGDVYDLTDFLNEHPAGPDILRGYAGKDISAVFRDVSHSQIATQMMVNYKVCSLADWQKKHD